MPGLKYASFNLLLSVFSIYYKVKRGKNEGRFAKAGIVKMPILIIF
jgi:hypothetical protein